MSFANNPNNIWRFKVISRANSWMEIPCAYERVQQIAYALYQSIQAHERRGDRRLPSRWKALMSGRGENWPTMIFDSIKRFSVQWRPLGPRATMPDGQTIAEALLQELEWMRNDFAIPLVQDAGGNEKDAYQLIGDIMINYLRAVGDVVEAYLRDEMSFQVIEG